MSAFSSLEDEDSFSGVTLICPKDSIQKVTCSQFLRINYLAAPTSFHPHRAFDIGSQTICKALFEGLTRVNAEGKVQLAAADVLEMSAQNTHSILTLTLRPSKWSNGEKVTSFDYVRSWEKLISSKSFHAKRFFHIKNAEKFYHGKIPLREIGLYAPCEQKIIIEIEHSSVQFLQLLADPIYSPLYDPDSKEDPTVFNGPFIMKHYDPKKEMVLHKNPMYWDEENVTLEKIKIYFIEDQHTVLSMYKKNQLDWIGTPFNDLFQRKTLSNVKLQKVSAPFWMFCNVDNPKLASKKIRKALSYGIGRKEIIAELPNQGAMRTILPEEFSFLFFKDFIETDLIQAKELFKQGLKDIGLKRKDFTLTLNHSNILEQKQLAHALKKQWEDVFNIKIILIEDPWNIFYHKIKSKQYELGGFYLYNTYHDPSYFMEYFEKSYHNHSGWENIEYERNLKIARTTIGKEQRDHYFRKAEAILIDEMPVIPIYNHTHSYISKKNLKNFTSPKFNYIDFKWIYFEE